MSSFDDSVPASHLLKQICPHSRRPSTAASVTSTSSLRLFRSRSKGNKHSRQRSATIHNVDDLDSASQSSDPNSVTLAEFDALPESVQKKYFTSTERLRFAQQAAELKRKRQPVPNDWSFPSPVVDNNRRPRTSHSSRPNSPNFFSLRSTSPVHPPLQSRTTSNSLSPDQPFISEEQAFWFMTLPEKVRRQQFGKEELRILTWRCERILNHSSPDPTPVPSAQTLHNDRHGKPRRSSITKELVGGAFAENRTFLSSSSASSSLESTLPGLHMLAMSRTRQQSIDPVAVVVPPSRTSSLPSSPHSPKPSSLPGYNPLTHRREPISRTLRNASLTPLPLPPPRLSPVPLPISSRPQLSPTSRQTGVSSPNFSRPRQMLSMPDLTASDRPREAAAQLDQRVRSGSHGTANDDHKFEPAMEFEFTMDQTGTEGSVHQPMEASLETLQQLPNGRFSPQALRSSSPTGSESDGDDRSLSTRGPRTPVSGSDSFSPDLRVGQPGSIDSGVVVAHSPSNKSLTSVSEMGLCSPMDVEMPLRITLTRPSLHGVAHLQMLSPDGTDRSPMARTSADSTATCPRSMWPESSSHKSSKRIINPFKRH